MGKAQEAAAKRRNKAARKRLRSSGAADIHNAFIAAKRRRKAGKRRCCEGMCFSLPTAEDPFNDRSLGKSKKRQRDYDEVERRSDQDDDDRQNEGTSDDDSQVSTSGDESSQDTEEGHSMSEEEDNGNCGDADDMKTYDKRLFSRLVSSSNGARIVAGVITSVEREASHFETSLWEACREGLDVIGTVQDSAVASLAYVPAVADYIVKQPSEARLSGKPVALLLVPSQEDALHVRNLCKPLKKLLGIHCISIHSGTSLEHQIEGLKASPCQILVGTPERLCELLSRKALNLSDVSFLVVQALDGLIEKGFKDKLEAIKMQTNHTMQVVILSRSYCEAAIQVTRSYVEDPVARVVESQSLSEQAACITQDISIIVDDSKRLPKVVSILHQFQEDDGTLPRTLILVKKPEDVLLVLSRLNREGFDKAVAFTFDSKDTRNPSSLELVVANDDMLDSIDLSVFQKVINVECPASISRYRNILICMARKSVHGSLHTFCGCSSAPMAHHLVDTLKQCGQPVPSALRMLANAAAIVKNTAHS